MQNQLCSKCVGVRLCSWAHDPRRVFADLGNARVKTQLGKLYLEGKLTMAGHTPVLDPGDKPVKSRRLVRAALPTPLKILSWIQKDSCSFRTNVLSAKHAQCCCQTGHDSSCQRGGTSSKRLTPSPSPPPSAPSACQSLTASSESASATVTVGTIKENAETLTRDVGDTVLKETCLPTSTVAAYVQHLRLVLCSTKSGGRRVWLHNNGTKDITIAAGTCVGRGGSGAFVLWFQNLRTKPRALQLAVDQDHESQARHTGSSQWRFGVRDSRHASH